jgi:hypothetical protein
MASKDSIAPLEENSPEMPYPFHFYTILHCNLPESSLQALGLVSSKQLIPSLTGQNHPTSGPPQTHVSWMDNCNGCVAILTCKYIKLRDDFGRYLAIMLTT